MENRDPLEPYAPKRVELDLASNGRRIAVVKPSPDVPTVIRIRSFPVGTETFAETRRAMDAEEDAHVIFVARNRDELGPLKAYVGGTPHYERAFDAAPVQYQVAIHNHLGRDGLLDQRVMMRAGKALPVRIQRIFERLGSDGYALLGGQQTFARTRAAQRLVTASYLAYKKASTRRLRDTATKELLALNIVSQMAQALENFCAFFTALKSTADGSYDGFGAAFLNFGRRGQSSVIQTLDELSGNNAGNVIGSVFQIPLSPKRIRDMNLAGCGIDENALLRCAQFTLGFVRLSFRTLARVLIRKDAGVVVMTPQYRLYNAVKHGFAVAIPALDPGNTAIAYNTSDFSSDVSFEDYVRRTDLSGNLMYLDADGAVSSTHAPITLRALRQMVRVVYRCSFWIREFGSYAERRYGSIEGKFPYLMMMSRILGPEQAAILEQRLALLDGE